MTVRRPDDGDGRSDLKAAPAVVGGGLLRIERRSIDFVPESERHGRVTDQGPFWFLCNCQFFVIAIGFVGPSLGLSLGYTALAAVLGIGIGTVFQAFHASQGPGLGLPQMIQSRAQFGFRGVIVPLIADLVALMGYNVIATVLIAVGLHALWGVDRAASAIAVSLLAGALAIWGHDWLHRTFKILFWISLPLFIALSGAIVLGRAGGTAHAAGAFAWPAFLTQLASAASYNITAAPYVSDYSRYLPRRTRRDVIVAQVFGGSAVSAIWMIILGAWLASRAGFSDGLIALKTSGDAVVGGLGSLLAATTTAAVIATIALTAYSAMLASFTIADGFTPTRPSRRLKALVVTVMTAAWTAASIVFSDNAVTSLNALLVIILYVLAPWTAVNLIDYFFVRRGRYAILDLFTPHGIYGAWGVRGLFAYALGFAASLPFFVVPNVYTGPIAARLGGVDIGWLVSLAASAGAYLLVSRRFDPATEADAVARSEAAIAAAEGGSLG